MEQLMTGAFFISLLGGIYDLMTRRIPNWLSFPAMALGLGVHFYFFSWPGLWDSFLGLLLGFVLFFPIYFFKIMGAGDVKLLMAVGAWSGVSACWRIAFLATLFGALYALFDVAVRGRLTHVFQSGFKYFRSLVLPFLSVEPLKLDEKRKFAFGICITFGVLTLTILRHRGINL